VKPLTQAEFETLRKAEDMAKNIGGRPQEVGNFDRQDPRDDSLGRAFGLTEKKTLDASRRTRSGVSYPWLRSSQALTPKRPATPR
jgi:hypothetical protein